MTQCPTFTTITASTQFITANNVMELFPSTFDRTVGTVVNVTCQAGFILDGVSTFTCQSNGQWSFSSVPICRNPTTAGPTTAPTTDDTDTNVLIGVVAGVAALIVIILVALILAVWYRDKRRRQQDEDIHNRFVIGAIPDRSYRGRDDLSTIEGELYGRESMPYRNPRRGYDDSQMSGPMYLPESGRGYKDRRYRSRPPTIDDEYDMRGSRPYVREWVRRSSEYDFPSVHGRGGYRDSKLWREVGVLEPRVVDTILVPYKPRPRPEDEIRSERVYVEDPYDDYY